MTLSEKQERWIAEYLSIEDAQERLAILVDQGRAEALELEKRTEERRVAGCVSAVWLEGRMEVEKCYFRVAADSALVGGLAGLLCRLYSGHGPEEVASVEPIILSALRLDRQLSATRLNGLLQVRRVIREFAEAQRSLSQS